MPAPISSNKLAAGAVLIVGNAWSDFTSNEIDSVGQFVSQGGGLLLAGLGWSWSAYHSGMTMEDYPMTKLAAPYGGRWLKQGITDPTNQTNGAPVFHTFYPNGLACTPFGAIAVITNAHLTYGNNLPAVLETNVTLRTSFVGAHAALSMPSIELPASDSMRLSVFDFCFSLIQNWPAAYARTGALDQALYPTSVWLRERLWRSARDSAPLTPERKLLLADAAQLTGKYRDLFLDFGIVLLDNCRLVTNQLGYLYTLIALVPPELHSLQSISVTEFLGNPPLSISLEGASYGVNIFGAAITSGPIENQFPSDVSAGYSKIFCSAAAHELNHIVDACTVGWSSASSLANRRAQLISDAGTNHLNYLRSGGADGFFVSAPQEFFASIANQWFTDSAKVLELAKVCFQAGRSNPINQALFFAEVYSRGGQSTYFYNTDLDGYLSRKEIPLRRDQQGCITGLQSGDTFYSFTLNQNSNVTALTTTLTSPPALACSVSNSTLRLSWPEIPLGYELEYTPGLTSPFWLPLTNKPVSWAGSQTVTVSLDSDLSFFRLRSLSASP